MIFFDTKVCRVRFQDDVQLSHFEGFMVDDGEGSPYVEGKITVFNRQDITDEIKSLEEYFDAGEDYIILFNPLESDNAFKIFDEDIYSIEIMFDWEFEEE